MKLLPTLVSLLHLVYLAAILKNLTQKSHLSFSGACETSVDTSRLIKINISKL